MSRDLKKSMAMAMTYAEEHGGVRNTSEEHIAAPLVVDFRPDDPEDLGPEPVMFRVRLVPVTVDSKTMKMMPLLDVLERRVCLGRRDADELGFALSQVRHLMLKLEDEFEPREWTHVEFSGWWDKARGAPRLPPKKEEL